MEEPPPADGVEGELPQEEEPPPVFANEAEELDWKINKKCDESLESTRRMVELCENAKAAGIKTLVALDDQEEKLDKMVQGMIDINEDLVEAEKAMNSMGAPCWGLCTWIPFGEEEESPEEKALWSGEKVDTGGGPELPPRESDMKGIPMYGGFIAKYGDDKVEEELEQNMQDISNCVGNLRNMAIDMQGAIINQNELIDRINIMCDSNDVKLTAANERAAAMSK